MSASPTETAWAGAGGHEWYSDGDDDEDDDEDDGDDDEDDDDDGQDQDQDDDDENQRFCWWTHEILSAQELPWWNWEGATAALLSNLQPGLLKI